MKYRCYSSDAEAMIRTVREFDEVADDLEFTEANEKFTNFRKCLRDVAHDDWDTAKVGQDMIPWQSWKWR
eukprot:scaffold184224_cov24-Attheya_sp.AAC.2